MSPDHGPLTQINIFAILLDAFFFFFSIAKFGQEGSLPYDKSAMGCQQQFVVYICILAEIISADEQAQQDRMV